MIRKIDTTSAAAKTILRFVGLSVLASVLAASMAFAQPEPQLVDLGPLAGDRVSRAEVVVPMVFPVIGKCSWRDTFLASRGGGTRRHLGQDIMAPQMTPLVAAFDGVAYLKTSGSHNTLRIQGDNGWCATYMHINNDTPGTNDGQGTAKYAFAPGLSSGDRVKAGQLVAFVGNSGNAEGGAHHLHLELWHRGSNAVVNAAPSLNAAAKINGPSDRVPMPADLARSKDIGVLGRDDILIEGTVRSADSASGRVEIDATAVVVPDGNRTALNPSRAKTVTVDGTTVVYVRGDSSRTCPLSEVQPSRVVSVIGRNFGVGAVLPAREIALGDAPAPDTSAQAGNESVDASAGGG